MFEIEISSKIKWENREIEKVLREAIQERIKMCPVCNSKNIKVYVYDIQKSGAISVYVYCKDCGKKTVLKGEQNFFKELDKLEEKIKEIFK